MYAAKYGHKAIINALKSAKEKKSAEAKERQQEKMESNVAFPADSLSIKPSRKNSLLSFGKNRIAA